MFSDSSKTFEVGNALAMASLEVINSLKMISASEFLIPVVDLTCISVGVLTADGTALLGLNADMFIASGTDSEMELFKPIFLRWLNC